MKISNRYGYTFDIRDAIQFFPEAKIHGDFHQHGRRCWDIEFPNLIKAAKFADSIKDEVSSVDIRILEGIDTPESLWTSVTLTVVELHSK